MFRRSAKLMSETIVMLGVLLSLVAVSVVRAEDAPIATETKYLHLEPAFVVNYGSTGRMKYLRTEIALKVSGNDAAAAVSQHKPYIRNNLVMLLSAQEAETMNSSQGRESLRKVALDEVRALMVKLEGSPLVDDLFFSNFVVQN
ncbi:MAG: flagellar basal body-associated protein FliL [Thalassobium sp.]|uniref:Flagellar protein FliL n=1 Tax=Thalassolituus pacificus TaxID=2975440 RepID=A0A9X2WF46_9GAMM|nr:flagellar basal body-associated FliL family protein [Thalassolituus pacificus]MCT7359301.1 flagellar basal body-associated FliL family protein [Thalassolituus pacificus]PHS65106.1 MAG: flagellar basal body-associated protein FliL [Thalassobium sp.]